MNRHTPLTLKKMLLLAFLLAGLLPALLVSTLSFYQARLALRTEIKHDLRTTGEAVAGHIDRVLFERVQNVHSWSQLNVMQDMQIGDIDKRLAVFLDETQHSYVTQYRFLDVINNHGQIVASSHPYRIGQHLSLPAVWQTLTINQQLMTLYHLHNATLPIAAPIVSNNTLQPMGMLVASFNWDVVTALLNQAAQHSTELALLDAHKQILAHSANWSSQMHSLRIQASLQGTRAWSEQPPWGAWAIHLNKDHAVAVAPVYRLGAIFLALLAIITVSAMVLVSPIARSINQPLQVLTRYVQQIRQRNIEPPALSGPVEIRDLQQAFTRMREELQAYEQQLTQAAKLAVVGEMAAAMSHEVRTPLGIMRSSAEVLLREPALTADGKEVLGFIISETERLNKLVSGLIDAARPRLPNTIPLDLGTHIRHVLALLQKQAEAKEIQLVCDSPQPVMVAADQDQMTQVLVNLVLNAIQILPRAGRVTVTTQSSASHAEIQVADNGPGVPEAQQAQLFDAFFTQRAGGVGLGLAVVKQIVEAHGGKISYSPSPMQGAQFNITLPLYFTHD